MFTKRVRTGTVGVGVAKPVYSTKLDWGAIAGAGVIIVIVLMIIGSMG